jgi:hypothetical protein
MKRHHIVTLIGTASSNFNFYHMEIKDLNPCIWGLLARLQLYGLMSYQYAAVMHG